MDGLEANPSPEVPPPRDATPEIQPRSEQPELWRFRDLLLLIPFSFLALVLSSFLVMGGYWVLRTVTGWRASLGALQDNTFFLLAVQTVFYCHLFVYVYVLVVGVYGQPFWSALRWRGLRAKPTAGFLLAGISLAWVLTLLPSFLPDQEDFPLGRLFSSPAAAYAVAAFAILVAPIMEELIFRGILFSVFERLGGLPFAVVSTALLFAGLHVSEYWGAWNHVLLIVVVGFAFSFARGFTGSITPGVLMHLAYNASQMVMLFFGTHHFKNLHAVLVR